MNSAEVVLRHLRQTAHDVRRAKKDPEDNTRRAMGYVEISKGTRSALRG